MGHKGVNIIMSRLAKRLERDRYFRERLIAVVGAVILVLVIFNLISGDIHPPKRTEVTALTEAPAEEKSSEPSSETEEPVRMDTLTGLKSELEEAIESYPGDWSVYVKRLDTGEELMINERDYYPASVIKLFAMGAVYESIKDGNASEELLSDDIRYMAAESNNVSFNNILWTIGKKYVNDWCQANGYTHTVVNHGVRPADNADGLDDPDPDLRNVTSVRDVGAILEDIYYGRCVSKPYSAKMLTLLLSQKYRSKIPAGLPVGVTCANKTGETYDVSHDCAIVYTEDVDYILVVMSETPDEAFDYFYIFPVISKMVYEGIVG